MDILKKSVKIRDRSIVVVLLCISLVPSGLCEEEYQREIYLGPRNFNPHPFEHRVVKNQDPGPVVFPEGDIEGPAANNKYNIITVDGERTKQPVDSIHYSQLSPKIKYYLSQKFNGKAENQIDDGIYNALGTQGPKVLSYAPQQLNNYDGSQLPKKNYAFAYKVLDKDTGDDFSHQQTRSSKATNGEYRVKLPDGRLQIVSYIADNDGYKADVKYELDPEANHQQVIRGPAFQRAHSYVPQQVEVSRIPVDQYVPRGVVKPVNSHNYFTGEVQQLISPQRDSNVVVLGKTGPTQIPINLFAVARTPRPEYLFGGSVGHRPQAQHYPNVQIYPTNPRDHYHGNYAVTTAATPLYEKDVVRYTSTPVPPTLPAHIMNNGGVYNPNLVNSYASPSGRAVNNKNVINTLAQSNSPSDALRETLEQENELPEGIYIVGKNGKR